jgi:hypothetical protein
MQIGHRETLRLRQGLSKWPQLEVELFLRKLLDSVVIFW